MSAAGDEAARSIVVERRVGAVRAARHVRHVAHELGVGELPSPAARGSGPRGRGADTVALAVAVAEASLPVSHGPSCSFRRDFSNGLKS